MTQRLRPATQALRLWGPRQWGVVVLAGLATALVLGLATVLIPNGVFSREIPPVWWNYPVWIATSALTGVLVASCVSPVAGGTPLPGDDDVAAATVARAVESGERRSARLGAVGTLAAWFAVGCPVCNKLALLALGSTGALTWFAPVQPWLGVLALVLSAFAVVHRLAGQMACPVNLPVSTARNAVVPAAAEVPEGR
jgi:MFS family permease